METKATCKEYTDLESAAVREAVPEPPIRDMEQPCEQTQECEEPCESEQWESQCISGQRDSPEIKGPADHECGRREPACKGQRKLRKRNSSKMVRFQMPSEDESVSERDSAAETLFPEYTLEEWTTSTFEKLFGTEDWQDITGRLL